ncbi:MAG TPA: hypothetical protein VMH80_18360 [Bryobacteraceae bacterium]|nr:hypothetical protein [Bryobacteraceae bacterium]
MIETVPSAQSVTEPPEPLGEHKHLLANRLVHEDGFGPAIDIGPFQGHTLAIHLEIDHVMQHRALRLSVWGSPDGVAWGDAPLISLPPKHYCGNYIVQLDLSKHPDVRYLRAGWKTSSWEHGSSTTLFGFSVVLEPNTHQRGLADRSQYAASAGSGQRLN